MTDKYPCKRKTTPTHTEKYAENLDIAVQSWHRIKDIHNRKQHRKQNAPCQQHSGDIAVSSRKEMECQLRADVSAYHADVVDAVACDTIFQRPGILHGESVAKTVELAIQPRMDTLQQQ